MTTPPLPLHPPQCRITVHGALSACWSDWFDGLAVHDNGDGTTTLAGAVQDQAALHGLLVKIRDLGLPLLDVHVEP